MNIISNVSNSNYNKLIRVEYFALFDIKILPGVFNKINQSVRALNKAGYESTVTVISISGLRGHVKFLQQLFSSRADIIILRSAIFLMPLIAPVLMWKRLQGSKIIIDVPTPATVALRELKIQKIGSVGKSIRFGILLIFYPWALYPANKILQYANESSYFSIGLNRKTKLIANGIDVEAIPFRNTIPPWSDDNFVMIAVGALAPWHGFDRVIRGIARYLNSSQKRDNINIRLIIVGDGESRKTLEKLVVELQVDKNVSFAGFQTGVALDNLFDQSHVAIASLGLFRIGLNTASVLKSREYTARGLPFISAGTDIDFDPPPDFVFNVDNSDELIDIENLMQWYSVLVGKNVIGAEIREFAKNHLDFDKKIYQMVSI